MKNSLIRIIFCLGLWVAVAAPLSFAYAHTCDRCPGDCRPAAQVLRSHHEKGEKDIIKDAPSYNLVARMTQHKFWTLENFFKNEVLPNMMKMATQITAAGMDQMRIVGVLFDAKQILETNRTVQELQVQANKDYQPSESFCWFGTNTRSLAESENRSRYTQEALSQIQLSRQLGTSGVGSAEDGEDMDGRWRLFQTAYCDPKDNNWFGAGSGLQSACGNGAVDPLRRNRDIDFTGLIETPRTLLVDFEEAASLDENEVDVIALASNLYGHRTPARKLEGAASVDSGAQPFYLQLRSVMAKRAVAQESYNAIVGLKGTSEGEGNTAPFLSAIARDAGLDPGDVEQYLGSDSALGNYPSTYAQLEVLSQKMFQNPKFFVTLYDKPANIERKKAALNAIELMLDRYLFESELRQEMLLSVLLNSSGKREFDDVFKSIERQNQQE